MPIISTFFGIVIRMFYQEHEPPHFHAEHQGQQAKCNFDGEIIAGSIRSRTARELIRKWAVAHRRELETNWESMKAGRALDRIAPLD
ncbi:MAG: transcriptional regulator [Acidobacteria bacterium]|nr:MAG: transcriptional regulator [Acidobacteriota bacterium]